MQPLAKKSLGQNFLKDKNIARKIVETLQISHTDRVLEIGPGPGALTVFLQEAEPTELVLVEKDRYWAAERQKYAEGKGFKLKVIEGDALETDWGKFETPWKFIGNLPYNVASPIMWDLFSRAKGLTRAVFMIQKEVGERIVAKPGSKTYGALSAWVQSHVQPRIEFIVPPQVFNPRPKVDSAVLSFVPLGKDSGGNDIRPSRQVQEKLEKLLHLVFQQRRKQLGTIFRGQGIPLGILEELKIATEARPETLNPEQFQKLAALWQVV